MPGLDAFHQGQDQRRQQRGEVAFRVAPGAPHRRYVHQREYRHRDGGRQGRGRQIMDQRGEEQRDQTDTQCGDDPGDRRARAGVEVDHRARQPAGDRHAAGKRGGKIGGAQADELLIRRDPLAALGGKHLTHRHRFDEADDADQ